MRAVAALAFSLLVSAALATESIHSYRTYNFGNRVLTEGDSLEMLLEIAGKPTEIKPQTDRNGNTHSERYNYHLDGKMISVWVVGRKVVSIDEVKP